MIHEFSIIPLSDLLQVSSVDNVGNLFIAVSVDHNSKEIKFLRDNLSFINVPFSAFQKSGKCPEPDFDRVTIIDCGQTVRLGEYEAAVDAILDEYSQFRQEESVNETKV